MTPAQAKQAVRLYRAYQTGSQAYRELAAKVGLTAADLTARCWRILHPGAAK